MILKRTIMAGLSALALTAGSLLVMSSAEASTCVLYANVPTGNTSQLKGNGGRKGCTASATVTVDLRKDNPLGFDDSMAKSSKTGTTVDITVTKAGAKSGKYFVETTSSTGAKLQSSRKTI